MKQLGLLAFPLLTACSLVFPASDHQGGTSRDSGVDAAADAGVDMTVDAGPECTEDFECDTTGMISCIEGECVLCHAPLVVAAGTPADKFPIRPLHSLILPGGMESSSPRVLVSYATGDEPGDVPALIRMGIDDATFGTNVGDFFPVLGALSSQAREDIRNVFGFAMTRDPDADDDDPTVYWTTYAVASSTSRHSRFMAFGDFFSSVSHSAHSTDAPLTETFVAEPAILMSNDTANFISRTQVTLPGTTGPTNTLRRSTIEGSGEASYTSLLVPSYFSDIAASGHLVAMGARDSSDVLIWDPDHASAPLTVQASGRGTRPALATEDGVTYYLAYTAGPNLYVLRGTCTGAVDTCSFAEFGRAVLPHTTDGNGMFGPAIQVLGGHVFVAVSELRDAQPRLSLRAFRSDGTLYPTIAVAPSGMRTRGDAVTVDELDEASRHEDVSLALLGGDAGASRAVVSYLRSDQDEETPNVIGIARVRACEH